MDTYGDKGNIITLQKRCEWRGIETTYTPVSLADKLDPDRFDIYFFGGGQDRAQTIVGKDLSTKSAAIKKTVDSGAVLLSICGGYQLLQKYFQTKEGEKIEGTGLFDAHTIGSDTRMIQNLLVEINPDLQDQINTVILGSKATPESNIRDSGQARMTQLIGFENHSGKTYLGADVQPLGKVIKGAGNNGEDGTEGAIYKNAFGCYLHGSLLPKNPHFADYLISKALEKRYGKVKLKPLDDTLEWQAHDSAVNRAT
jgi:hypothetical protein